MLFYLKLVGAEEEKLSELSTGIYTAQSILVVGHWRGQRRSRILDLLHQRSSGQGSEIRLRTESGKSETHEERRAGGGPNRRSP